VIVVDSSALIAILHRDVEANSFLNIMVAAEGCLLSTVGLVETSIVLAGRMGNETSWVLLEELFVVTRVSIAEQDYAQAGIARHAFLRYGKGRHPAALNMGDCAAYALAKTLDLPLLFKGNDFSRTDLVPAAAAV
jgi:ribonuclease VapC